MASTNGAPTASRATRRGMGGSVRTARVRLGRHDRTPSPPPFRRDGGRGSPALALGRSRRRSCRCWSEPHASTGEVDVSLPRALAAGVVALALQVGTNFANDYSDGVRGTDDPGRRVGPVRLVGWGIQPPGAVKRAALAVVRRRGASRGSRWPPSSDPSCSSSAPPRSPPAGSTPAARTRTATTATASCSSSRSSVSWPPPARPTCRPTSCGRCPSSHRCRSGCGRPRSS